MSKKYIEHRAPTNAVQVNNYGDNEGGVQPFVRFPQMTVPEVDELPELKEHAYKSMEEQQAEMIPEGFIDGEFSLYEGED